MKFRLTVPGATEQVEQQTDHRFQRLFNIARPQSKNGAITAHSGWEIDRCSRGARAQGISCPGDHERPIPFR